MVSNRMVVMMIIIWCWWRSIWWRYLLIQKTRETSHSSGVISSTSLPRSTFLSSLTLASFSKSTAFSLISALALRSKSCVLFPRPSLALISPASVRCRKAPLPLWPPTALDNESDWKTWPKKLHVKATDFLVKQLWWKARYHRIPGIQILNHQADFVSKKRANEIYATFNLPES